MFYPQTTKKKDPRLVKANNTAGGETAHRVDTVLKNTTVLMVFHEVE